MKPFGDSQAQTPTDIHRAGGGEHYGKIKIYITVYYGYYGILFRKLRCFNKGKDLAKSGLKTLLFFGKIGRNRDLYITDITEYYGYYGILQILRNFYYEILRKITACNVPPPTFTGVSLKKYLEGKILSGKFNFGIKHNLRVNRK
jgi:hypothetical protein